MASETASDEEHPASGDKSLVSLLLRLAHDAETLVLQELMLARAEFLATLAGLRDSSLLMAIGLLVAFVGLMALVASGILALSERMAPWLALPDRRRGGLRRRAWSDALRQTPRLEARHRAAPNRTIAARYRGVAQGRTQIIR